MTLPRALLLFVGLLAGRACAQPELIPEAETLNVPTPARLAAIHAAAQRDGWAPQVATLRAAAIHAYHKERLQAAEAWCYVFRWAAAFGQTSAQFVPTWIASVNGLKVGHQNMPRNYPQENKPLAAALSPELQAWLIGNPTFSEEFFSLLAPVDYLPEVFRILNEIHRKDPAKFKTYASLALAIAVVYDVPPPPIWPHGQVPADILPRRFPAATDAFAWFTRQEQLGKTYQRLARLGADELKFVVDVAAPFAELEWAQGTFHQPLNQLPAAYTMIRYRNDRAAGGIANWPGPSYKLDDILKAGGICADQAYFATEIGKSRGVPTLFFYGAGNDGRHAWFGYLDGNQKWQLDAGRYAEQRFVTGLARDPQTWREFSDHELVFLTERFHLLPSFRQSQVHTMFAAELLAAGDVGPAAAAARKAVNYERRNQIGWEILFAATARQNRDPKAVEALLREAALAFQKYPDLEAYYINRVAESLRNRGETSLAENEVRRIARKNEGDRTDLSVQQARNLLLRSMQTQSLPQQIQAYNSIVDNFGRGAGIGFFDQVVTVFVEHLLQLQQPPEALKAIERARHTLKVDANSQLDAEFNRLAGSVRK